MITLMLMLGVALFLPAALLAAPLFAWGASLARSTKGLAAPSIPAPSVMNGKAEEASEKTPSGTVAMLLAAIDSRHWYVRQSAARQLGRLGLVSWPAIPRLEQAVLVDEDNRVRLTAAEALEQIRGEG